MILDSSAIIALFFQEPGYEQLAEKLANATFVGISSATLVECGIVLAARLGQDSRGLLARFLQEMQVTIIPYNESHFPVAIGAWLKFGKGRHAAALNFGDCLSYATAHVAGLPLLCVGADFPQTDLVLA
jgi:ribonuclease VapC